MWAGKRGSDFFFYTVVIILAVLSACDSRAVPDVPPQDEPAATKTELPVPTLPPTPMPSTPTAVPAPPTATPTPTFTATPTPLQRTTSTSGSGDLPDLSIGWFDAKVVYNPGTCGWSGGQMIASVANIGATDAGSFLVYINKQEVGIAHLPAGARTEARVQYNGAPPGGLTVRVDALDAITESDETNNFIGITFTPPPTCTPTLTATPTPGVTPQSGARIDLSVDPSSVNVGDMITVTGVPSGIGLPYYTLYIDANPAVTVTYSDEIKYQAGTGQAVEFVSASATGSGVEFTLQALRPGSFEVGIGASGEVRIDYGDGTGAWSWGGAAADSVVITVTN